MDTSKELFAYTCVRVHECVCAWECACSGSSGSSSDSSSAQMDFGMPQEVTLDSTWGLHVGLTFEQPFTLCEYWHRVKVTYTLGSKGRGSQ